MVQAIRALALVPDFLLLDYLTLPNLPQPQRGVPHGDSLSLSIAAASIIAKVTRDRWMIAQDVAHAGYGFARHKGYGTAEHLAALGRLGPCTLHRLSFRPVRDAEAASGHGTSFRNSEFEFQNPKSEIRNPKSERAGAVRRGRLGSRGEDLAVAYLARQGYALIARNWRTRAGELDIVAQDGEWLVFVEVRTRRRRGGMDEGPVAGDSTPTLGAPEESLTRHKQARLATMAETYLFESPWAGPWRIDVVALELWPDGSVARLNHLRDAVEGWP
jgi:Holliday junction resolvase-like predicted endonuclease